jgi:hypothetical protein
LFSVKKQLFFIPIPFLNAIPLFVIIFVNHKYLNGIWQLRILPYMAVVFSGILFHWLLNFFCSSFLAVRTIELLTFYLTSILISGALILFQRRNGIK